MNAFQAIFFDLDGTLIDTALDMGAALNRLLEDHGKSPLPHREIRPHVSNGANALLKLGFGELEESTQSIMREKYLDVYSANLASESVLFTGMDKVLAAIEAKGLPWGIVTNKPAWLTEPLLQQMGLFERSACVVSADTCEKRKPHPMPMYHACELTGTDAQHCLYVGDAIRDVEAGRAAGMKTVAAAYGYITGNENPQSWGADGVINTCEELLDWI